ncbi:GCG_CRPN prefix-to-repeats domain-containing protein [Bradyrhizobium sp. USDA 3364]
MKYLFAAAVLVTTAFAGISAAEAAGGCGPGWHRGPYGGCVRNRGVVVAPGAVVVAPGPVVVAPRVRACPYGFVWRYGRCRPI